MMPRVQRLRTRSRKDALLLGYAYALVMSSWTRTFVKQAPNARALEQRGVGVFVVLAFRGAQAWHPPLLIIALEGGGYPLH